VPHLQASKELGFGCLLLPCVAVAWSDWVGGWMGLEMMRHCLVLAGWVALHPVEPCSGAQFMLWRAHASYDALPWLLRLLWHALPAVMCRVEYEPEDSVRILPLCRHYYHPDCIGEWLQRNKVRG
jgi:hypothetical protein